MWTTARIKGGRALNSTSKVRGERDYLVVREGENGTDNKEERGEEGTVGERDSGEKGTIGEREWERGTTVVRDLWEKGTIK